MSNTNAQIAQYKDAIKILKKKCSSAESQYNDIKSKYDSLESTLVSFLEFITSPFSESNLQPDLTMDGLRCWWEIKKEGLFIEDSKNHALQTVSSDNSTTSALQTRIVELQSSIKKAEFEKKDLEFNLERKTNDYQAVLARLQQVETDLESYKSATKGKEDTLKEYESQVTTIRNEVISMFLLLSHYLDVTCDKEEEIKSDIYSTVQRIFPAFESDASSKKDVELVLLSAVDKMSLLKTRFHALEDDLAVKSSLITNQSNQLNELMTLSDNDKTMITRLREIVDRLQSENADTRSTAYLTDERVNELEKSNASLREALQSLRESMKKQQEQVEASESKCITIQKELVSVQQSSNDLIQQMYTANEEKMKTLESDNTKLSQIAEDATNELSTLRMLLEQTTRQYEQELTVLREKKDAMEQQVTVSEKFLDNTNRAHREELTRLTIAEKEAQKETQILRISLIEKESELRACMENFTTLREQSQKEIHELSKQLMLLQQQRQEEQTNYEQEKKVLAETEQHLDALVKEQIQEVEQKEREVARQQQRLYEEELVRVRKQVQVLSHQLEEERKSNRKTRDQINQLNAIISSQNNSMEQLQSEITRKDSELLAGKQQINKLTTILTKKLVEGK